MDDRVDLVIPDDLADQFPVGDIADDQLGFGRHRPFETGGKPSRTTTLSPASSNSQTMWLPI